jgi:hypothetical protein
MIPAGLRWARVQYRADLRRSGKPVPLGVAVMHATEARVAGVIIGREPARDGFPPELKGLGDIGRAQLQGWVNAMAKDALEAIDKKEDPLVAIANRWRWNLAVGPELEDLGAQQETLVALAARLYEKHVGEPVPREILEKKMTKPERVHHSKDWISAEVEYTGERR